MNTMTLVGGAATILLTVRAVHRWRTSNNRQRVDRALHPQDNPDLRWLWGMSSGVALGLLWALVAFGAGGLTSSAWLYVAVWVTCQAIPCGLLAFIAQQRGKRGDYCSRRPLSTRRYYGRKVVMAPHPQVDLAVLMALERDVSNLAAEWHGAPSPEMRDAIAQRYHETLDRLCRLGWDGPLGAESALPDKSMHWEWYTPNYGLWPTD